ncbi:MAG: hypothetical protein LBR33_07500 [Propionibacteriaceae bacterium]|jgi:hypothetical protein|nr:hypothetical protein [Propionibacteriaceae bacterium]
MPTRRPAARRALLGAAAVALAATALAVPAGATFTDTEAAAFAVTTPGGWLFPDTYLPATLVAVEADGEAAYVWGDRRRGLGGGGAVTVAAADPATRVTLGDATVGERLVDLVVGGAPIAVELQDQGVGLAALDGLGDVWTWGCLTEGAGGSRCGRDVPAAESDGGFAAVPGRVTDYNPALDGGETVIDLKSTRSAFFALTSEGDLYSWGDSLGTAVVGQGPATAASARPRRILTGVHSFGVGPNHAWAIVTCGWTATTWADGAANQGAAHTDCVDSANFPTDKQPVTSTIVFWGASQIALTTAATGQYLGGGRPIGGYFDAAGYVATPTQLEYDNTLLIRYHEFFTSAADVADSPAYGFAGTDEDTGVRQGALLRTAVPGRWQALKRDRGGFKLMTGHEYGSQVVYRSGEGGGNRGLLSWGNGTYLGAGRTTTPDSPGAAGFHGSVIPADVAHSRDLVLVVDTDGNLYSYGLTSLTDQFPDRAGALQPVAQTGSGISLKAAKSLTGWAAPDAVTAAADPTSVFFPGRAVDVACNDSTCVVQDADGEYWLFGGAESHLDALSNYASDVTWSVTADNAFTTVRDHLDCRNSVAAGVKPGLTKLVRDDTWLDVCE